MKNTEYAIVDIETTGGNASGSRITEIAIIIHDGKNVLDRYETLVNPEQDIPPSIFGLTGINNEMVANAPIFDDISEKVLEMLTDRVFVAHNVNFDYSFVHHQLEKAGFKWSAKKLCTVRAARKIKPGLGSYSLGNLCNSLNIGLENRHRAGGDADATAILFSLLLEWDDAGEIDKMIKKTAQDQRLPPNLPPDDFNNLPEKPGVYYFYNQQKKVIYVGKAINVKKRVASHFSGNNINPQRQHFLRDIHGISFEICGTELMALLLECTEIKKLWPTYNRALKRFEAKFGIYQYEARNGYKYLAIGKVSKFQICIHEFNSQYDGINLLRSLAEQFEIDHRFCKYTRPEEGELFQNNEVKDLPDVVLHNEQVDNAIDFLLTNRPTFAIIDKGRSKDERSCIWIENGHFHGMGYIPSDVSIHDPLEVKNYTEPYKSNQYIEHLIFAYAEKHPGKVFFNKQFLK
ncbi:DNA polymerase III subunit epsilon [Flavobacterium sp. WLB]|uniref:exonuclease domain-containing protein n=1 Tax=unclassified Flavobacterium TaxID=196869 RepID=UPI0006ABD9D6|nr:MULTISPECIES: exonuclease domain-containing protein [unclassified Flavobacterium]KOP37899.1 DNA polymerase III subunit epsilon [Flavobacterium sp. VMW]OWU90067.1 DNA polymerase III subunit epsilon [Flavobacterium sp. NLM]PUU70895.1 DNA polymerase III subunit epsilon [Flavobacterium sp. WLB]